MGLIGDSRNGRDRGPGTGRCDLAVVGAGIVGLAVAREFLRRRGGAKVIVADKQDSVACHQTGHNSGMARVRLPGAGGGPRRATAGRFQLRAASLGRPLWPCTDQHARASVLAGGSLQILRRREVS